MSCREFSFLSLVLFCCIVCFPNALNAIVISQKSTALCSPPIVQNSGNITIKCEGVDRDAIKYLEEILSNNYVELKKLVNTSLDGARTSRNLNDVIDRLHQEAEGWAVKYHSLENRLEIVDGSAERAKANVLVRSGRLEEAEKLLIDLASKQIDSVVKAAATQFDLGEIASLTDDSEKAASYYRRAVELSPENVKYHIHYAETIQKLANFGEAEAAWSAALRLLNPDDRLPDHVSDFAKVEAGLAETYESTNRRVEAEAAYTKAIELCHTLCLGQTGSSQLTLAVLMINFSGLEMDLKKPKKAIVILNDVIDMARPYAREDVRGFSAILVWALLDRANDYYSMEETRDAEADLDNAIKILNFMVGVDETYAPNLFYAHAKLATVYLAANSFQEAITQYELALSVLKNHEIEKSDLAALAIMLNRLSVAEIEYKRYFEARGHLRELIGIDTDSEIEDKNDLIYAKSMGELNLIFVYDHDGMSKPGTACLMDAIRNLSIIVNQDLIYAPRVDKSVLEKLTKYLSRRKPAAGARCV